MGTGAQKGRRRKVDYSSEKNGTYATFHFSARDKRHKVSTKKMKMETKLIPVLKRVQ